MIIILLYRDAYYTIPYQGSRCFRARIDLSTGLQHECIGMAVQLPASPVPALMQHCTLQNLRESVGRWQETNEPARYRLHRDLQRNPLIKGWAFGQRRFWGACDEGFSENHSRTETQSRWETTNCKFRTFDPPVLCHHLLPHKAADAPEILFVGDSYTGELFISFVSLMRGSVWRNEGDPRRTFKSGAWVRMGSGKSEVNIPISELRADALACVDRTSHGRNQRSALRIAFIRNEMIEPNSEDAKSGYRHGYAWLPRVHRNTILVLQVTGWSGYDGVSLGARFKEIADKVPPKLADWQRQILLMSPSQGHKQCQTTTSLGLIGPKKGPTPYHVNRSLMMHDVGKELASKHGIAYVDMTTPLISRSDGHMPSDCGHWCLPGPYDAGSDLLFNALLALTPARNPTSVAKLYSRSMPSIDELKRDWKRAGMLDPDGNR